MNLEAFRSIADLLPEPMLLVSADSHIHCINHAASVILGVQASYINGKPLTHFTTDSSDKLREYLRDCVCSSRLVLGALCLKNPLGVAENYRCDGARAGRHATLDTPLILLRLQPRDRLKNRFTALKLKVEQLNREISERRRSEQALREYTSLLDGVVNNSSAVIYIKDPDGRYIMINHQYTKLFGVESSMIKGKTDFDLFDSTTAEQFRKNDLAVIRSGKAVHIEEVAALGDELHSYISVKFPLMDEAGNCYGVCGISTDITELKRAEDQILQLNKELESRVQRRTEELELANKDLEAFSYSVSHDLRAPLRSIHGFSHLLDEDYKDSLDQTGKDYLRRICASAERMSQLIDDILNLSRIGRREPNRRQVNMSRVAVDVVKHLREQEPTRNVEVNIQAGLRVLADDKLLRIAMENLLTNAWKYTGKQEHAQIELGLLQQAPETVYYVKDNGVGFDMENSENLFMPFHRLHGNEFDGTGIGLATVKRIIQCHHGRIWAQSSKGEGTSFYFTLANGNVEPSVWQ